MALNPQYDAIGKAFVQQYYTFFDDAAQRHQLSALYNVSSINVHEKYLQWSLELLWSLVSLSLFLVYVSRSPKMQYGGGVLKHEIL